MLSFLFKLLGRKDKSLLVELLSAEVDVPARLSPLDFDVVLTLSVSLLCFDCKPDLLHLEDVLLSVDSKVREILVKILYIQVLVEERQSSLIVRIWYFLEQSLVQIGSRLHLHSSLLVYLEHRGQTFSSDMSLYYRYFIQVNLRLKQMEAKVFTNELVEDF